MDEQKKEEEVVEEQNGAFISSLKRNNRQIREDRAQSISEDAEMIFRRKVEDLALSIKKMKRERENMLDMSPTDAQSLVLASDFDADVYVEKEMNLAVKIRNSEIKLELARERFTYLFGGTV